MDDLPKPLVARSGKGYAYPRRRYAQKILRIVVEMKD
jgi:hypothetical protein